LADALGQANQESRLLAIERRADVLKLGLRSILS
jgi:hypothetical protein